MGGIAEEAARVVARYCVVYKRRRDRRVYRMVEAAKEISQQREPRRRHGLRLLEEIGAIITHASDQRASVQSIVEAVATYLSMEVCSVYVYDPAKKVLTLWATTGLDPSSVGRVSMGVDEGLTGIVIQKMQPVMAIDAMAHPRYKYFPETGEERYHSFLGVPVVDQRQPLGVLIMQTSRRRRFTREEVRLLKAIAVPVAGILAQTRLRARLETKEEERLSYQQRMVDAMDRLRDYETHGAAACAGPSAGTNTPGRAGRFTRLRHRPRPRGGLRDQDRRTGRGSGGRRRSARSIACALPLRVPSTSWSAPRSESVRRSRKSMLPCLTRSSSC